MRILNVILWCGVGVAAIAALMFIVFPPMVAVVILSDRIFDGLPANAADYVVAAITALSILLIASVFRTTRS